MGFQVISIESLLDQRRKATSETQVPFIINGKQYAVVKKLVNGEMEVHQLNRPLGEMMTGASVEQHEAFVGKVVLDVELGREAVPLIYTPIYERMENENLPEIIDAKWALHGAVVFTQHMEGEEVKFGSLSAEEGPAAHILTWAAGFEYTKRMVDFNDTFSLEVLNKATGESYNAFLNDMHLSPIINHNYKTANKTAYLGGEDEDAWLGLYKTLNAALTKTRTEKRPASVLLASSSDQPNIEMALKGGYTIGGTTYPAIGGVNQVIFYDGWSVKVGEKTYEYPGVTPGKAYLIRPRRGFKELIKRDLQVEATLGDLSRLVQQQMVAYAYRGVSSAVEENIEEVTITAS